MLIDCTYLCPSLDFADGFLVIIGKTTMLLNRKTNIACFFIEDPPKGTHTDCEDEIFCISDSFSLLWERFGNSTCSLKLEGQNATVKITQNLCYKIPLEFTNENEEGLIGMKQAVHENTCQWCEVEFTENRHDILEFFEGDRIIQIYSEKSHVIIEDNEFRLSLKILTPNTTAPKGTFLLKQVLPRNNNIYKLEYKTTEENGPLFIRENNKVVILVSPYIGSILSDSEIKASDDSGAGSDEGVFTISVESGVVTWSPPEGSEIS